MKNLLLTAVFLFSGMPVVADAQARLAVPSDIKQINLFPPKEGRLIQVRGFVVYEGKEWRLVDPNSEHQIQLDFSKSERAPIFERRDPKVAIDVTGRVFLMKDDALVLQVIGFSELNASSNQAKN